MDISSLPRADSQASLCELNSETLRLVSEFYIGEGDIGAMKPSDAAIHEERVRELSITGGDSEPAAEPSNALIPRQVANLIAPPRKRRKTRKVYLKLGDISAKIQKLKRKRQQVKTLLTQKKALLKDGLKNKEKPPSVSLYTGVGKAKLEASAIRKKLFDLRTMRKRMADAFVSEDELSQEDTDDEVSENNSQQESDEEDSENSRE